MLDNLEQLVAGVAVVGELLGECPGLVLLVTSREPLHLAREHQYEVPELAEPDAIELLVTRAHTVAPRLHVDSDLARRICARLDCLPLTIELAASRTQDLSLTEILARLDRSLPLLTGGPRDAPRRQRTLRATIDWSYELLNRDEQRLFARLTVFAGGCTLDGNRDRLPGTDSTRCTRSSIAASCGAKDARYWMLHTLREYALERLEQSGDDVQLRHAHAEWLVELLTRKGSLSRDGPTRSR